MPRLFARFRGEVGDAYVRAFEGMPTRIALGAATVATDAYWSLEGGPWEARYRRSGILAAIGLGRDHVVNYDDPHDALAHFEGLGRRYRRDPLRSYCLVTYKGMGDGVGAFHCVQPYASTAADDLEVMIREVASEEQRAAPGPRRSADPPPRRLGGRKRRRPGGDDTGGPGWSQGLTDRQMYDHFTGGGQ
jgi:hypothetical protein